MPNPNFDRDRAAKILIDAITLGDRTACDNWGITRRTLDRYKARLSGDPGLSELVREKKEISDRGWAEEIPTMLKAGVDFLKRAANEASVTDPDVIHAIAGAVKVVSEVKAMRDVIDARLSQQTRTYGEEDRQMVTISTSARTVR